MNSVTTPVGPPGALDWEPLPPAGTAAGIDEAHRAHRADRTGRDDVSPGSELVLDQVGLTVASGRAILRDVSLSVGPGELVAIVGASGSGKSTLLQILAGNQAPTAGRAAIDGRTAHELDAGRRRQVGYVPQDDDVLHGDLPLRRMLTWAARLRLPAGRGVGRRAGAAADRAIGQVELQDVADVPVRRLSGGQRRRASLAIELLTAPRACLLDEPTSGLDPATAETILAELRMLADRGRTVVFVTHNPDDLRLCDRIVAVGRDGRLVFDGTPAEAIELAGSNDTARVHRVLLAAEAPPRPLPGVRSAEPVDRPDTGSARPSRLGQLAALTARSLELMVRNRLTGAIMVGSPAMVVAMFAILFQADAFDPTAPSATSAIMAVFWVAFGGFFFGLTYGLLQICPEVPIMGRERRAGVSTGLQVAAKMLALAPILVVIDVVMLAVLVGLDRLPAASIDTYAVVAVTLTLDAVAALALGLLASALVRSPAQASLALPMLCFPAVLFSGAVLPVPVMAPVGRAISAAMPDRWAFEAIGADLGLPALLADDPSGLGPALLWNFGDTWTRSTGSIWIVLAGFIAVLAGATWLALELRCRQRSGGPARSASASA